MKDALLTVLSTVLSVVLVGVGLFLIFYFLKNEFAIVPFLIGLVGYFISIRPAIEEWQSTFRKFFGVKDDE